MRKTRQWVRANGKISPAGGQDTHLGALAYMSDSYFVGTIPRVHFVKRFSRHPSTPSQAPKSSSAIETESARKPPFSHLFVTERAANSPPESSALDERSIGMMVSLDHSIYFHRPREVVADDWLLSENESPWSGGGRGLVIQKIWSRGGRLLATCVQEVGPPTFSLHPLGLSCNKEDTVHSNVIFFRKTFDDCSADRNLPSRALFDSSKILPPLLLTL